MTKIIRVGIVGTGSVARLFARALPRGEDTVMTAVVSRSQATARAFAAVYAPTARTYEGLAEMLADEAVDVVYLATPNHLHAAQAAQALDAGKPVLVEKPFATTAAEARAVIELARRKRLFCMEAMWMRCMPLVRRAKQLVAEGAIGEVQSVSADFTYPTELGGANNRFADPAMGGGALLDRGVYCLSLAFLLLGPPSQIASAAELNAAGADLHSEYLLRARSGATALLSSSLVSHGSNAAIVTGTTGTLRLHEPFYRPERLTLTALPGRALVALPAPSAPSLATRVKGNGLVRRLLGPMRQMMTRPALDLHQPIVDTGYQFEATEAARCLREGLLESPLVPLDETLGIMEAMDEIRARWRGAPTNS